MPSFFMKTFARSSLFFWLAFLSLTAFSEDKLTILSPHRQSMQDEYISRFKKHYLEQFKTEINVDWLDQGGSENDMKFIFQKYKLNPASCGVDIFWGGGDMNFQILNQSQLLEPKTLSAQLQSEIPRTLLGAPLHSENNTWHATALSSFGIFYNKRIFQIMKWQEPKTWEDLANPAFVNMISLTDLRRSSTTLIINLTILQSLGWKDGWRFLTLMAANAKSFSMSSSDPIKSVVEGDVAITTAVDYFAYAKILVLGEKNLGFVLPEGKTVFNADPVAILKGASNRKEADRFIDFLLSVDGQRLQILSKGAPQGPIHSDIARMSINALAYENLGNRKIDVLNPFKLPHNPFHIEAEKITKMRKVFSDLVGAIHIDTHKELKAAWNLILKSKDREKATAALTEPMITEQEFFRLTSNWDDSLVRNRMINEWVSKAKAHYSKAASM